MYAIGYNRGDEGGGRQRRRPGFVSAKQKRNIKKNIYINKTLLIIIYTYVQYTDRGGREDSRSYNMRVLYYYYIHIYYNICTYTHIVHDR